MSKVVKLIIKLFDNLITLNNIEISIFYDKNKKIWFSLRDVFNALGYKNVKAEIKRLDIKDIHITNYINLHNNLINNNTTKTRKHLHPQLKLVDESGIYIILNKSNKPLAKEFQDELFSNILPKLREDGQFKFNTNDRKQLQTLKNKLKLIQKEQTMKRLTTKKYTDYKNTSGKGFLYVLNVKKLRNGKEEKCYKLGYATNLNKRLDTYKTGHPDIDIVYQENVNVSKKQLEKCILNLNIMKRLSSKNEIICNSSLEEIKNEIKDCKKMILKYSSKKQVNKTKKNNKNYSKTLKNTIGTQ
jgi:prophage antirepressor-like protein